MWDARYSDKEYAYGTAPNEFLKGYFPRLKAGAEVLCLAEGEGRNAVYLAEQGYRVTAVDLSAVGLQKAQHLAAQREVQITCVHADLGAYDPGSQRWDAIVAIFCHLPRAVRARLHAQIGAALKPGGYFVLEAYTPEQLQYGTGGPPDVDLLMTATDLQEELVGLQFKRLEELERAVVEGRYHTGTGSVVQVLAHKSG